MKKLYLLVTALVLALSSNGYAYEGDFSRDNTCYINVLGGANFLQTEIEEGVRTDYRTGYIVSTSVGYEWCYGLRLEAEYAFRRNTIKDLHFFGRSFPADGRFQSSSYMGNLLWDLPLSYLGCDCWDIHPFIGGGIGYDFQLIGGSIGGFDFREKSKHFSWQVMAGLAYPIFCNLDLMVEYTFHKGGLNHLYNHSIGAGLTYRFGAWEIW